MWADLMKPVVHNLTNEDLVNILAYTVSRPVNSNSTKLIAIGEVGCREGSPTGTAPISASARTVSA